jgi:hypothetical protein
MSGDRTRRLVAHVLHRRAEGGDHRVRLGRVGQVDHRVGEVELRFGHPHELDRARRRVGDDEAAGVGHPNVLRGQDHEPARDEARILARGHHAREPVEAGIDVRTADALDERGEHVVVLVVAVAERAQRERRFAVGERDRRAPRLGRQRGRDVERRQRVAGVALGAIREVGERVVVDAEMLVAQTARVVGERVADERTQLVGAQRLEPEQGRA